MWSPDSSKVATAFETDIALYDAAAKSPTQARLRLRDSLVAASIAFELKTSNRKTDTSKNVATPQNSVPASFNPIVRLEWPAPEKLYFQTAYVRLMPNDTISTFQRWHLVVLSAQAAVLK